MTTINKALISVDQDVKIYGVTNKAKKLTWDAEREQRGLWCCFVIKPTGIVSKILAILIFTALMISGITIPLSAAFDIDLRILGWILDFIFGIDMIAGFFSGYFWKDWSVEIRMF